MGKQACEAQQPVVIIGRDGSGVWQVADYLRSEGYEILKMQTLRELGTVEPGQAVGATLCAGSSGSPVDLFLKAARQVPYARFVVMGHEREFTAEEATPLVSGEQLLCLAGDPDRPAQEMRRFLRQEPYQWAGEFMENDSDSSLVLGNPSDSQCSRVRGRSQLIKLVRQLSRHDDLSIMLDEAVCILIEAFEYESCGVYRWDEDTETLRLAAGHGGEISARVGLQRQPGEGLAGWVARARESVVVHDMSILPEPENPETRSRDGHRCVGVPLEHGEELLGVLCLTLEKNGQSFGKSDLRLAQAIGEELSSLIHSLSVLSEMQSINDRMKGILRQHSDLLLRKDSEVADARALSTEILNGIPLGIVAYDSDLEVRSVNSAGCELLGLAEDVPQDRDAIPLQGRLEVEEARWAEKLASVVRNGDGFRMQRVPLRIGGGQRLLNIHGSALRDAKAEVIGGILTIQDVTEDVEIERRLTSAERLALIGKMGSKVAHELNNPLDGILRFLSIAERKAESDPETTRQHLQQCRRGLQRMGRVVNQLLSFARNDNDCTRQITVSQVISEALAFCEGLAYESDIEVISKVPADLPVSPSAELFEVMINLLKNALEAMDPGGRLEVEAWREEQRVRVTVSDTGPGIAEEIRDRIFEPFFTTRPREEGTGLGLTVCQDIMDRMHGDITVTTSEEGSIFELIVPIEQ